MFVVALTGGIGSGKSEAAKQFANIGIPVVDLDVIAHELTAIGAPMLSDIVRIFGQEFLAETGALNRAKLREHVFNQPNERLKLQALIHPAIHANALKLLQDHEDGLHPPYQILVVPLLFENNHYDDVINKILVIDCDETLQIQRTMARSKMTEAQVKAVMSAQVTRATRLALADEIIKNNGSVSELHENISLIHKKFIKTCIVSQ